MPYTTGRTKTFIFAGTWGGGISGTYRGGFGPPDWRPFKAVNCEITAPMVGFVIGTGANKIPSSIYLANNAIELEITPSYISANPGFVTLDGGNVLTSTVTIPLADYAYAGVGTWQVTVDCEEYIDITEPGGWGGSEVPDPPLKTKYTQTWKTQIGGRITCTASWNGTSCTLGGDINQALTLDMTTESMVEAIVGNGGYTVSNSAYTTITSPSDTFGIPFSGTYTATNTTSATWNSDGTTATVTIYKPAAGGAIPTIDDATARITFSGQPEKKWNASGVLRAWKDAYPGSVTLEITGNSSRLAGTQSIGSSFSLSDGQRNGTVTASGSYYSGSRGGFAPTPSSATINEDATISFALSAASLREAGDDSRDRRLLMRGWRWTAGSIIQSGTVSVDAATHTATGPSDMTIALSDYSGSWKGQSMAGGQTLRLHAAGSASDQPFNAVIYTPNGTKTWAGKSISGTASYVEIDLCAPGSAGSVDTTDTQWPYQRSGGAAYVVDGDMWGVSNATAVKLTGLSSGRSYSVDAIDTVRKQSSKLTVVPAFDHWVSSDATVGTADSYRVRLLDGWTDGRRSLEQPDFSHTNPVVGDPVYSIASLATMLSAVNGSGGAYPTHGWSAATATFSTAGCGGGTAPLRDCYLNNDRAACFLYGAGAWNDGAWNYAFDMNAAGSLTLTGQTLFDEFYFMPGCGDLFGFSDSGINKPAEIRLAKILRGHAQGLVQHEDASEWDRAVVAISQAVSGAAVGSGTTDAYGLYATGLDYAKGTVSHIAEAQVGSSPYVKTTQDFYDRHRRRICFRPSGVASNWISYDVSRSDRHYRAYTIAGTVWTGTNDTALPLAWEDVTSSVAGLTPCVRIERNSQRQRLWMAYANGTASGTVYTRYSPDEGATWSSALILGTGTFPTFHVTESGDFHFFWRGTAGDIRGLVCDANIAGAASLSDCTVIPEFQAVAATVDSDALASRHWVKGGGTLYHTLMYRAGSAIIVKLSTDGTAFS